MKKRIVAYLVAALLVAAAAAVAVLNPGPHSAQNVAISPIKESVVPGSIYLACPGPLVPGTTDLTAGAKEGLTFDPQFAPNKDESVLNLRAVVKAPKGNKPVATWRTIGANKAQPFTASGDIGLVSETRVASASVISASPSTKGSPVLAGSVASFAASNDLRGLAGAACLSANSDAYLVGGDTRTQSTANLFLVNVGETSAVVSVSVWGTTGQVRTIALDAIAIPQDSSRVLQLPGIARDEQRLVVRVRVTGGDVASYLQDSRVDGITPLGVDYVVPSLSPAKTATITGLRINETSNDPANPAVIRLLAPGTRAAKATIQLFGPDGLVDKPGLDDRSLDAGIVTDIPIAGLPAGTYTAVITADQPIVAGAELTNPSDATDAPMDRSWVPTAASQTNGMLALPGGPTASLVLHAATDAKVSLTPIDADGKPGKQRTVSLTKQRTVTLAVADLASDGVAAIEYESNKPVDVAAVLTQSVQGGDLITVLTPTPTAERQDSIEVGLGTRLGLS